MKTKYVCHGFISPYVNFHYNRTMWSTKLHVKICRGERKKSPGWDITIGAAQVSVPRSLQHKKDMS